MVFTVASPLGEATQKQTHDPTLPHCYLHKWVENLSWSGCDWLDHIDLFNPQSLIFQYYPRPLSHGNGT